MSKRKLKKIGLVIIPSDQECTEEEKIYMRAKFVSKLIEWSKENKK